MDDIKRDFTQFSDRFMQFMQTAVGKMKSFDFDMPFGEPMNFITHLQKKMWILKRYLLI